MSFRPSQLREKYRNIMVNLDPPHPPVHVSVTKYACQIVGYGGGQAERIAFKDRIRDASRRDRLGLAGSDIYDVFTGKGSVVNIEKCLRLAARHRVYFHEGPHAGPGEGLSVEAGLRRVADSYIGLDCNGFVGNWARAIGAPGATPSRAPIDWLGYGELRQSIGEIRPFDVVIWTNRTHIAVVETCFPPTPGADRNDMYIAESSTGGIQVNPYVIRQRSTPITVRRNGHTYSTPFTGDTRIHGHNFGLFFMRLNGVA